MQKGEQKMNYLQNAKKREIIIQNMYSIIGNLIYCFGFNMLIVPMGLYS